MAFSIKQHSGTCLAFLLVGMTLFVYSLTLRFGFVCVDDPTYLMSNPRLWDGLTVDNVRWAFTTTFFSNWHPLTWLSYMLDMQLFGYGDASGFHLTNVALHTANVLLLFGALRLMTGSLWHSAFVAAVFAVHPLRVESVAWVSERKDVLSTLFGFLAVIAYARYAQLGRKTWFGAAWVAFALSLMAKQTLVTLPFVFLLLDYWPLARLESGASDELGHGSFSWKTARRLVIEKWPFFLLTIAGCIIAVVAQHRGGAIATLDHMPVSERLQNLVVVYGLDLVKTVWPSGLVIFYPFPPGGVPLREVLFWTAALSAITIAAIRHARRRPYVLVGWLWYLGTLVPVSGIVQIGPQRMADRYMYVPGIGLAIAVAWLMPAIVPAGAWRRWGIPVTAVAALVACMVVARRQTTWWADSVLLLERSLDVDSSSAVAHQRLGVALAQQRRFDEAVSHYEEALRLDPGAFWAHDSLGNALISQGKTDQAIEHFEAALRIAPGYASAHYNLGMTLLHQGDADAAREHLQAAARLEPDNVVIQRGFARLTMEQQHSPAAPDDARTRPALPEDDR